MRPAKRGSRCSSTSRCANSATAALQSPLPRPCSQPSATRASVGPNVHEARSPKPAVSSVAFSTVQRPGPVPTTSQYRPTGSPAGPRNTRGARPRSRSQSSMHWQMRARSSSPARLGVRTSVRISSVIDSTGAAGGMAAIAAFCVTGAPDQAPSRISMAPSTP